MGLHNKGRDKRKSYYSKQFEITRYNKKIKAEKRKKEIENRKMKRGN